MTVWMTSEDVFGDGLHFGLRWMRDWLTLMTFWMTFQMTAGRRYTTDADVADVPSYYIDDG